MEYFLMIAVKLVTESTEGHVRRKVADAEAHALRRKTSKSVGSTDRK